MPTAGTPSSRPGQATLVACWQALAHLSPGARVVHLPVVVAAVFPSWTPLNNAIAFAGGGHPVEEAATEAASLYEEAGVEEWALWVPSLVTDLEAPDVISGVGSLARDT